MVSASEWGIITIITSAITTTIITIITISDAGAKDAGGAPRYFSRSRALAARSKWR
jgi:hypothetical protein